MKRKERLERIEKMKEEIRRRGGVVHLAEDTPLEIVELFLEEVLRCPECMREAQRRLN